jgi:hypothetical protein
MISIRKLMDAYSGAVTFEVGLKEGALISSSKFFPGEVQS